jgi:hypothetical protein
MLKSIKICWWLFDVFSDFCQLSLVLQLYIYFWRSVTKSFSFVPVLIFHVGLRPAKILLLHKWFKTPSSGLSFLLQCGAQFPRCRSNKRERVTLHVILTKLRALIRRKDAVQGALDSITQLTRGVLFQHPRLTCYWSSVNKIGVDVSRRESCEHRSVPNLNLINPCARFAVETRPSWEEL